VTTSGVKMREEMEKQIADLKKKGKDKMLSILNPDQRGRLEELLGDRSDSTFS
jgi:hypothetical protein